MNVPTIKILQEIGLDRAKACARKLGYTCGLPEDTSLALGNVEVSLEEQVNAYSVYANNGYVVPGVYIRKIVDRHGRILEEHLPPVFSEEPIESDTPTVQPATFTGSGTPRQSANIAARPAGIAHRVMDEATALTMTDMLRGVVQEGTAKGLKNIVDRPDIAGKTGTSKGYVNAWFVGYTPAYTAGVWVGFDDNVSIGDDETGGKVAAPIWGGFMKHVLKDEP
jgi:penicillin-binding protein 1A